MTTPPTPEVTPSGADGLARCVGDVGAFLTDRFTRAPHQWSSGGFDDLLSLEDVDAQLSGAGLRRPAVRVVRDGELIDPTRWTRRARTGAVRIDDLVDPGRVLALFDEGATVVLQSLQRWWAPLTRFCTALGEDLGHTVQANAYLTPPAAAGLTPHHDTHDVFVLQIHGTKHWVVREPLVLDPLARHRSDHERAAQQPVLFEVDLHPGDCLYLPRGFIHSAAAQQGASLHLTMGVLATTVHDVLRRLLDRAAEEPRFRRTVRRAAAADSGGESEVLKEILVEFAGWLDDVGADLQAGDPLLEAVGTPGRRAPMLDGQLLDLVALDSVDDSTVLVRRGPTPRVTVRPDAHLELDLGDRRVEFPERLRPALELLLDGRHHDVGELGHLLDGPSRSVLVRRLIRDGVVRTVDGP